jgi:acetyl-CoA acetyltransferase family protein
MPRAVITSAVRSPFGKYRGGLSSIRPDDLLANVMAALVAETPSLDPSELNDIIMGNSNGSGEDNRNVARMSALLAGIPVHVPGVTVNRLCGSGAEAISQADRAIRAGDADLVLAGGVESMSRAPYVLPKSDKPLDPSVSLQQTTVGWRMINPQMPKAWTVSLGEAAQSVAAKLGITREEQDAWALRSHQRAHAAWEAGLHSYVREIKGVTRDESIRPETTLEALSALAPAFTKEGEVTAGNSSPVNDGAAVALIAEEQRAADLGLEVLGTIITSATTAVSPEEFTIAPVSAIHRAVEQSGYRLSDIDVFEINEAFAAMVLSVLHHLPEIDREKVNPNGGAIAMGHPIGASGARIVLDVAHELRRRGGGIGVAAACIGVGQGIAMVIKV